MLWLLNNLLAICKLHQTLVVDPIQCNNWLLFPRIVYKINSPPLFDIALSRVEMCTIQGNNLKKVETDITDITSV